MTVPMTDAELATLRADVDRAVVIKFDHMLISVEAARAALARLDRAEAAGAWREIGVVSMPPGRVRFLVTSILPPEDQDPTHPFPGDPYDGIELVSGPFDHPDGPRFLNHNSGNYCAVKHWTHWMPLPPDPAPPALARPEREG